MRRFDENAAYEAARAEIASAGWQSAESTCLDIFSQFGFSPKITRRPGHWQICAYGPSASGYKGCVCVGTGDALADAWENMLLVLMFTFSASSVAELLVKLDMRHLPKMFARRGIRYVGAERGPSRVNNLACA